MKGKNERDLTILGDLLRYSSQFFVPFCFIGLIFCLLKGFSLMALIVNPLLYSIGIGLIIVVFTHDVESVLRLVGLGKETELSPHITHSREIQEISILMGMNNYKSALSKADALLCKEPNFAMAHNLRGEILLDGYQKVAEARECFDRALELSQPGEEQHRIAESLRASTFDY